MMTLIDFIYKEMSSKSVRILRLEHELKILKMFKYIPLLNLMIKTRKKEIKRCKEKIEHLETILNL